MLYKSELIIPDVKQFLAMIVSAPRFLQTKCETKWRKNGKEKAPNFPDQFPSA
jgi:hypothetical protein